MSHDHALTHKLVVAGDTGVQKTLHEVILLSGLGQTVLDEKVLELGDLELLAVWLVSLRIVLFTTRQKRAPSGLALTAWLQPLWRRGMWSFGFEATFWSCSFTGQATLV